MVGTFSSIAKHYGLLLLTSTSILRSGRSGGRPRTRTSIKSSHKDDELDLPPPVISTGRLTPIPKHRPSAPSPSRSRESSVGGESRRISFAEPARPAVRRLYIPTKTASLASGFGYDPKLQKYGVLEGEWAEFSDEVVDAANVPTPSWAWFMHKKEVTKRIKRELQYEGDFKRVLRKWNKHFKRKGFQAWLELPVAKGDPPRSQSVEPGDSSDEEEVKKAKQDEKKYAKRFRMVVSSNVEKGSSVYSRTSSLTRSVSREAVPSGVAQEMAAQKAHKAATAHSQDVQDDHDAIERRRGSGESGKEVPGVKVEDVDGPEDKGKEEKFEGFDSANGVDNSSEPKVEKEEKPVKADKDEK